MFRTTTTHLDGGVHVVVWPSAAHDHDHLEDVASGELEAVTVREVQRRPGVPDADVVAEMRKQNTINNKKTKAGLLAETWRKKI